MRATRKSSAVTQQKDWSCGGASVGGVLAGAAGGCAGAWWLVASPTAMPSAAFGASAPLPFRASAERRTCKKKGVCALTVNGGTGKPRIWPGQGPYRMQPGFVDQRVQVRADISGSEGEASSQDPKITNTRHTTAPFPPPASPRSAYPGVNRASSVRSKCSSVRSLRHSTSRIPLRPCATHVF